MLGGIPDGAWWCGMQDLIVNLVTSMITATVVWLAQRLLRLRRLAGKRAFFGVNAGDRVLLFVSRHASSPRPNSVHRNDVAAIAELATVIRECGGHPALLASADHPPETGHPPETDQATEFCVGGPLSNPRTAAYLRTAAPGIRADSRETSGDALSLWVGEDAYRQRPDHEEYVVVVKLFRSTSTRPVFLFVGQRARTNLAAARYLTRHHRELSRRYGTRRFCLVLRVTEPAQFGLDRVTIVADRTTDAFVG